MNLARWCRFEAIGTIWEISLPLSPRLDDDLSERLLFSIGQRIEQFDKTYSRFRKDSLIKEFSRHSGTYYLPDDAKSLFDMYERLYDITEGRMTPLIGQLLEDAGYDADYSLKSTTLQSIPDWSTAMEYDYPVLHIKQPVLLDVGAAGKGYLVDIIARLLEDDFSLYNFCINAGGDMVHRCDSGPSMRVGLEHPDHFDEAIGVATIKNVSLCGSAGNRRTWERFTHIIDPYRQASPVHLKATWVVAKTTLLADALATALYFTEPEKLLAVFPFEYALIHDNYSLEASRGFPAEFFIENRKEQLV